MDDAVVEEVSMNVEGRDTDGWGEVGASIRDMAGLKELEVTSGSRK